MTIIDVIDKKRKKEELSEEEIKFFIKSLFDGSIEDYQTSSLLMAIVLNGMSKDEIKYLTREMLYSGETIDLSGIDGIKVDKHSTGGVGDKVTLILGPLLATFGIKVAKMSGRGLGHTGGTIDKLESIPGYKVALSREEFIKQVNDIGISVISQTGNICPADKKLYALRDVTGTVESIPLIASSIMSKKIASGADLIFIDVKVGKGALMKNLHDARELATTMIEIGKAFNKKVFCILTNMNEPLGYAVGNALEVKETVDTLKGYGSKDVIELIVKVGGMIVNHVLNIPLEEAEIMCFKRLHSGEAYNKLEELVASQHGDLSKVQVSENIMTVKATKEGYINEIDALGLGEIARLIGAGRLTKEDEIDYSVGLVLKRKVGDYVKVGDSLIDIYINGKTISEEEVLKCYDIKSEKGKEIPLIYEILS